MEFQVTAETKQIITFLLSCNKNDERCGYNQETEGKATFTGYRIHRQPALRGVYRLMLIGCARGTEVKRPIHAAPREICIMSHPALSALASFIIPFLKRGWVEKKTRKGDAIKSEVV